MTTPIPPSIGSVAVIGPFPPFKGGISQHTARLAEGFEAIGGEVKRLSWSAQYPKRLYKRDQRDSEAKPTEGVLWCLRWWDPTSWVRAGLAVRKLDVLVTSYVSPVHAVPLAVLRLVARRPRLVTHVHNVVPHESMPFQEQLAKLVLGQADVLVCHAESIRNDLLERGFDGDKILVTSHPPDLNVVPSPLPSPKPTRLLFLGLIRRYKGLDLLLDAFALLPTDLDVELVVAGEPWEDHGINFDEVTDSRIDLRLGYVADEDMVELINSSHLLVAPYRHATQSGVVSLALNAGRPVVATAVGGLPDVVIEGETGALAAPEDPASFADAIQRTIENLEALHLKVSAKSTSWATYAKSVIAFADSSDPPSARRARP